MKKYTFADYSDVEITGGFWKNRCDINRDSTAIAVFDRFAETHRVDALKCLWKEGDPNKPHVFWDSDVAKWIEGAAYIIKCNKEKSGKLEELCDSMINDIAENAAPDGYFNSHFLVTEKDKRFQMRGEHELYCAGHLFEAACAYYEATGKRLFLDTMTKYADLIYKIFLVEDSAAFVVCGHPEIELALVRLFHTTGEKRYLELAKYFVDKRGNNDKDKPIGQSSTFAQDQSHMPLKKQREAMGHSVRACYIYSAMVDIAREFDDMEYFEAAKAIFDDIINKKMYITGGVGSTSIGEAFTVAYDLPNQMSYAETCAAIAMGFFAKRMSEIEMSSEYADEIERVMYNGALSGVSLDGKKFFYENPLESDPRFKDVNVSTVTKRHYAISERVEVFSCSCCPPNILRFIAGIGGYFYSFDENTLFVHQFAESTAKINGAVVTQRTNYPSEGSVSLKIDGKVFSRLAVRKPGWCRNFSASENYTLQNGYIYIDIPDSGKIDLVFEMPVELIESTPNVVENANRVAVMRGPVVYCLEECDNGNNLRSVRLSYNTEFKICPSDEYLIPTLEATGRKKLSEKGLYYFATPNRETVNLRFIPFFAHANRGEAEMTVWVSVE